MKNDGTKYLELISEWNHVRDTLKIDYRVSSYANVRAMFVSYGWNGWNMSAAVVIVGLDISLSTMLGEPFLVYRQFDRKMINSGIYIEESVCRLQNSVHFVWIMP